MINIKTIKAKINRDIKKYSLECKTERNKENRNDLFLKHVEGNIYALLNLKKWIEEKE